MSKLIVKAITEHYGERCPDYDEDCFCCKVWSEYDALTSSARCDELETTSSINGTLLVTRQNAEEVIASKDARIAELEARLETANALVTCCCGTMVNDHGMGSGHSPVDQYHYAMDQLEADNKRLREALESIADWPNGGKNYGQENIKGFARAALGKVKP